MFEVLVHTARTARVALLACALCAAPSALAGTVMVMETRADGRVTTSEVRTQGGNLRADDAASRSSTLLNGGTLTLVDHGSRTYRVVDAATMRRIGAQVAAAKQQMQAQMANLPPEQRAAMQQMMARMGAGASGAPAAPRTQYRRTTRSERAAGVPCVVWEGFEGRTKTEEVCVAATNALPGGAELMTSMSQLGKSVAQFTQSMGVDVSGDMQAGWDQLDALRGVPVIVRGYENGRVVMSAVVKAVRATPLPAATFAPPTGYRRVALDGGR